ncbi:MAG: EAL domain-containing protein [Methylicorpusculum sp.]|nr:EAL domain-containing protein [Methylicorpusculum sp.]
MNFKASVQSAQLQQLFSASIASLVTSTLLAAILAFIQREVIATSIVLGWFGLVMLVALFRAALVYAFRHASIESETAIQSWLTKFRYGVLAVGIVWGSAGFLMFPGNEPQHQMFLIFMMAGLTAGGVISFSADLISAVVFAVTSLLPIVICLLIKSDTLSVGMGMAGLLYLGFMIVSLRHINRSITENIMLRLEAAAREEVVRTSEERLRLLLKHSPIGIFHYDTNCIITYCNEHFADIQGNSVDGIAGFGMNTFNDQSILPAAKKALEGELVFYEGQNYASLTDSGIAIDMTCAPFLDSTGKIADGIGIVRDITSRKKAEEMLRISAIAFESQSAMIVTDANAVIRKVKQAFARLTGFSVGETLGQTPHLFSSGRHDTLFFQAMWATLIKSGCWQGEVWNRRKNGIIVAEWLDIAAVTAPDGNITHYVGTYADITQNKDAIAEIHRLAYYDPLTHLPNRRLLQDRLDQILNVAAQNRLYGAILFLDLDNFKTLNDTRGHDAGDQLLIEVARRLRADVRENDIVGRLGGDEFVVFLDNLSSEPEVAAVLAKQLGEKVRNNLARPYLIDDFDFHCTASIGIRLYRDQKQAEELLRHADLAMYQAKTEGRNTVRFFNPGMQAAVTAQADMEKDLRCALKNNQFKLYFQPQVYLDRHIIGAEVLLRWDHPQQGLISPLKFIPLAEKTNLILSIGQWVMESACAQLILWKENSYTRNLRLAVNVSARQFRQPDFVARMKQALNNTGINPELLKLELTESLVLDNINDTIKKMNALREIGVRFSLDDFGTGYSSFSYLTQLPLDQLKIDRSFVHNIGLKSTDAIIVQTIIGMAGNLGIEVIAEGVETEAQLAFLQQHGCHTYQGYLFSKPVPIQEFVDVVAT